MTEPYTKDELKRFDALTNEMSSPRQMARITARMAVDQFVKEHGKEKCDTMFAVLQARDAKRKSRA